MDNSEVVWMIFSGVTSCGAAAIGHEWYGIRLAERAIKTDISDMELFELCLYLRDKVLDHDGYQVLANRAELLLIKRMNGGQPLIIQTRSSPDFEVDEHRAAIGAIASGALTHMELIDVAELAHSERHSEIAGAEWGLIYDLARIQILRRIKRTPAFGVPMKEQLQRSSEIENAELPPPQDGRV